jgi:large repetitive protein
MARTLAVLVLTLAARVAYGQDAGSPWVMVGSMSTGRWGHTATLLPSGAVLVVGGASDVGVLSSAEVFSPATGMWGVTASMATRRIFHSATLLLSGEVLIAGGEDGEGSVLASAELYDPVSSTWSQTGSLGTPRAGHMATLLPSGTVLVAGGAQPLNGPFTSIDSAEAYDPASGIWNPTASMATGRQLAGTVDRYSWWGVPWRTYRFSSTR